MKTFIIKTKYKFYIYTTDNIDDLIYQCEKELKETILDVIEIKSTPQTKLWIKGAYLQNVN